MPPREDLIVFLDLETTGTDAEKDDIIEIGMVMLDATKPDYPEIGSFSRVIMPDDQAFLRMIDKKVVREMHEANGLLDKIMDIRDTYNQHYSWDEYVKLVEPYSNGKVSNDARKWIESFDDGTGSHIPLGGSGVLHFDRRFLDYHMPVFSRRLTYWAYDVGVLRRTWQKAGMPVYSQEAKTHRALDDARVHADEWRFYSGEIRG
jgi:oligoribonuclease (3'-5' exoribonuclease)